ncbi:mate efflux family protein 7 [Phtheirospermum japonicum]|uniref:Mate efflux family protein 7 n=1 Tax=Phtheirospermum japonicum TaxID=374723 RepID=A0A830D477_9LAMI|nr:mate efflux family protein 7 [Phtheirospermum japonicum]
MESEEPLLVPESEEISPRDCAPTKWEGFVTELNKMSYIAMPMVVVSVSQYLLRAVSMMMLGHLGELALSSASIATSLTNVTGFSLLSGMASALETLCGQAYGAQHYKKVGTLTNGSIIWLCLACLPVCVLWVYTDELLILIGQDPVISAEAGKFSIWMIPSLFPYAVLQSLNRYLQTQSLIYPMLVSSLASLWIYVKCSSACKKTLAPFSKDVLLTAGEFFKFAIPSAVMICSLEWWTFEIVILLSGLLPNPALETSVLSICLTITTLHYLIPYSFGAAASTRVSNELGAGKPQAARLVVIVVLLLGAAEFVLASAVIFF